jgi:hypothetical protein
VMNSDVITIPISLETHESSSSTFVTHDYASVPSSLVGLDALSSLASLCSLVLDSTEGPRENE